MLGCDHTWETVYTQDGRPFAEQCARCPVTRSLSCGIQHVMLAECEWCGDAYEQRGGDRHSVWLRTRFCRKRCYEDDLEDRRHTGRALSRRADLRGRPISDTPPSSSRPHTRL